MHREKRMQSERELLAERRSLEGEQTGIVGESRERRCVREFAVQKRSVVRMIGLSRLNRGDDGLGLGCGGGLGNRGMGTPCRQEA